MTFFKPSVVPVDVSFAKLDIPIRYGEEDIPNNFPLRVGSSWSIVVDIETGQIQNWPGLDEPIRVHLKVVDEGNYYLLDNEQNVIASVEQDYVPHGLVPGDWGDYVILDISTTGKIENWPRPEHLNLSDFDLQREEDI